jgi:plasmid stabilization system protein ParE
MDTALVWWREHRAAAPELLFDEIDAVLELLARSPAAGRRVAMRGHDDVRRLLLPRSGYHLYYRVDFEAVIVRLVLFRHARRRPPAH